MKKLLIEPVVPLKVVVKSFALAEARDANAFQQILYLLADDATPASALALLCMCYRGIPAYRSGTKHSLTALATLLNDCEYIWSDGLAAVSATQLAAYVDQHRKRIIDAIDLAVKSKKIDVAPDWREQVLPPLTFYRRGALLPPPDVDADIRPGSDPSGDRGCRVSGFVVAESRSAIAGTKKWSRIPDGSLLEVRVSGEQLRASAM